MTFSGVLKGGGGGKAPFSWLTCCKLKVDQKGVVTSRSQKVLEIIVGRAVLQGWGQVQLTKYSSTPSTPNIYQVQVLVKYSFF